MIFVFLWLTSLSMIISRSIHIAANGIISFFLWPNNIPWYTHTHTHTMEYYYSAIEKNEIMPFVATWTDLEIVILSEVSQTEKDKYYMILLICGI